MYCGRFAPSATGPAHPGTLLAALLCWLDARSQAGRVVLRLEDLDPQRCSPAKTHALIDQIRWFGLEEWDAVEIQSQHLDRHRQALQHLMRSGRIYHCSCSRSDIKRVAQQSIHGGWIYPGTCRANTTEALHNTVAPLRLQLDDCVSLADENGGDLSQDIPAEMGDPIILRRDGAVSYLLAAVVDDAAQMVTHVVRGQDLASTTATQVALGDRLGYDRLQYRHHFLFTERQGDKLAKFHGSVGVPLLQTVYAAEEVCGIIAHAAGLTEDATPCRPIDLIDQFSWAKVRAQNQPLHWDGTALRW